MKPQVATDMPWQNHVKQQMHTTPYLLPACCQDGTQDFAASAESKSCCGYDAGTASSKKKKGEVVDLDHRHQQEEVPGRLGTMVSAEGSSPSTSLLFVTGARR